MASDGPTIRELLLAQVERPTPGEILGHFTSSSSAADAIGLRLPRKGDHSPRAEDARKARRHFQRSWERYARGERTLGGHKTRRGALEALMEGFQRERVRDLVRADGLWIMSITATVDVYGSDVRSRQIDEAVWVDPDDLEDANGLDFFAAWDRQDWDEAGDAVATAWFSTYVGNGLAGGIVSWREIEELDIRLVRRGGS